LPTVMGKEEKKNANAGIPNHAFKVDEIGPWEVFFSKEEKAVYFRSSDRLSATLRLSRDDLLMLAQEMEIWRDVEKNTFAGIHPEKAVQEVQPSGGSKDKRRFKRFTRRCETEFTSRGVTNRGIASDFSINGLFIRTNHPFAAETLIDIMVHLPDGNVSSLQGKVKRSMKNSIGKVLGVPMKEQKNGMGVELINKDATYLHFIRSLIK
jgi:hypothetical protein